MSVGIVTFHYAVNPGAFYQATSLLETVRDLGYEAEIINYLPRPVALSQLRMLLVRRNPSVFWGNFRKIIRYSREIRGIVSKKRFNDWKQLKSGSWDRLVFGSDIIWAVPNILHGRDDVYFGKGLESSRKIAYAASCGPFVPDLAEHGDLGAKLGSFDRIAVRDRLTSDWVGEAIGKSPRLVVDPTLLRVPQPQTVTGSRIVVYGYPFTEDEKKQIRKIANRSGNPLCSIHFYNPWCHEMRLGVGPSAWMESMREAQSVVTNTFHGTLISILLGKQFVTISRGLIGSKLDPILSQLGLEGQVAHAPSEIAPKLGQKIDYAAVYERLAELRSSSLDYLRESLG